MYLVKNILPNSFITMLKHMAKFECLMLDGINEFIFTPIVHRNKAK